MKQTIVNEFKDGLNLDLHPLVTPKTVLTDNINGTFITYNGNEFCLQNDRGNKYVTSLTPGYTPIGIKEHNGILYIVSVNENKTEIGTFPSPDYPESESDYDYREEVSYPLNLNKYSPLHVLTDRTPLTGIDLGYTTKTPVTIEIQDSYDGSVNLIIVADECKPRIINSGFSVLPNNKYKFVNRNQSVRTNIYDDVGKETELIRTSNMITNIELVSVQSGGQLKGGNYTFYIKFGDADFNQTDVVAESGIVSVFNGNNGVPSTISGTLLDERTDKMIRLGITGLNPIYSKIYVYYSREYSDTQGYRMTEYGMLNEPIDLDKNGTYGAFIQTIDPATNKPVYTQTMKSGQTIWITGFEQMVPINPEALNVDYHTIDWARAEAQHSNMLFLGNVGQKETFALYQRLSNFSKTITISDEQDTLPYLPLNYETNGVTDKSAEYYNVHNIYNRVGYYPGELYRFGIVYILRDGSKTPVFNVKGNVGSGDDIYKGVFKVRDLDVITTTDIKPIYLKFNVPSITEPEVIGWFIVRQKRIPNAICEGLSIAIDKKSNVPVIWNGTDWVIQSFLDCDREWIPKWQEEEDSDDNTGINNMKVLLKYDASVSTSNNSAQVTNNLKHKYLKEWDYTKYWREANALLSLDPCVNSSIVGTLDGSKFNVRLERSASVNSSDGIIFKNNVSKLAKGNSSLMKCVFVPSNTGMKVVDEYEFSNIAGDASDTKRFKYFTFPDGVFEPRRNQYLKDVKTYFRLNPNVTNPLDTVKDKLDALYKTNLNINLIRGLFCPYIGLANNESMLYGVYSIKHKSELDNNDYLVRLQNQSEYYAVTEYYEKQTKQVSVNVYRGDCYTNTVSIRIIRNFIDGTAPVSDVIVDEYGWKKWVIRRILDTTEDGDKDYDQYGNPKNGSPNGRVRYDQVNLTDLNTVDLGMWVTFKCLSSYNLGLRSIDTFHTDETALLGSPRSFYPLNGASTSTGNKMEESWLLNDGLSATVGRKRYNLMPDVPYSKSEFANRIMFSNVHVTDAFTNGYRTFQGLSYKDYDKQYGAITKLIPLGQNIFVVMEHGLGLVPVNPKALMQTTTGEAIHIYGYGVLPDEMTIISQDYGSKYEHSVIRTPIGIYGVDVDAKKVWRFSDKQGFETISDMKVETYLKDYLNPMNIEMGLKDIRTHYNSKKGDIMFTFYTVDPSEREAFTKKYFYIDNDTVTIYLNEPTLISYTTNMDISEIEMTCSDNLNFTYGNGIIELTGLELGYGAIYVNGEQKAQVLIKSREGGSDVDDIIQLSKDSVVLQIGQSYQLSATTNISNPQFVWTSSDNSIINVDDSGKITAIIVGSALISVTVRGSSVYASCMVTVQENAIHAMGVSLDKSKIYVGPNDTFVLKPIVTPDNTTDKSVTWSVSGNVSTTNYPNTFKATSIGSGLVTVTTNDGGYTSAADVIISDNIPITKIDILPETALLYQGQQVQFNAIIHPEEVSNKNIKWSVSEETGASIDETGLLTSIRTGSLNVIAKSEDESVQDIALVTILQNMPSRIVLSKNNLSIKVGETGSVISTLYCEIDDWISTAIPNVNYEIINTSIARITSTRDQEVFIEGVSRGVTTIKFTAKDDPSITASCEIIVTEGKLTLSTTYENVFPHETKEVTVIEKEGDLHISQNNGNVSYEYWNNAIYLTGNAVGTTIFTISDGVTTVELEAETKEIIPLNDLILAKEIPDEIVLHVGEVFSLGYKFDPEDYTRSKYIVASSVDNPNIIRRTSGERPQDVYDPDLWGDSDMLTSWTALRPGRTQGHIEVWDTHKLKDYVLNFEVIE